MSISRDEAREIAIIGLLAMAAVRAGAGIVQLLDELDGQFTLRSLADRLFAPIGASFGFAVLAAVLLAVLSPTGSVTIGIQKLVRKAALVALVLALGAAINTLTIGRPSFLTQLWIAMINGLSATVLTGTGYWIIRNFDSER